MALDIQQIHENVYKFLINYHRRDPDFLFTFRQTNRQNRLSKGYWFLGDDRYLAVSFWSGKDWTSKMPRIAFVVHVDGRTSLEFSAGDTSHSFFDRSIIQRLSLKYFGQANRYYKQYSEFAPSRYLQALEHFIETDKILIDRYVRDLDIDDREDNDVRLLYPSDFKKWSDRIGKYRDNMEYRRKNTGYIRAFQIQNFGQIECVKVDRIPEDCKWIFITGENGSGKTTLLRALATGICNNMDGDEELAIDYHNFEIQITLDSPVGLTQHVTKPDQTIIEDIKPITNGFAAYGPMRLITRGSIDSELVHINDDAIRGKKAYGLFHTISVLADLSEPLQLITKPKYHLDHVYELTENIEYNLSELLPNMHHVEVKEIGDSKFEIQYFQGDKETDRAQNPVRFQQLPSGTKNLAALILDLLLNFRQQLEEVSDIANLNGVVLIDEIDLHLHPKMQKEIVRQLSETFPKMQFIVTTHSPIPLLGAPENALFIKMSRNEESQIIAEKLNVKVNNLLPNTILTSPIFDFDEISSINHDKDERLESEDDYSEAVFYKILERKIEEQAKKR